jgi:hypothetical protein
VKVADVEYKVDGRYMTVKIAKADLGLTGDEFTINFSWTDNVHDEGDYEKFSGDIMDFYISGDVAPGGRFKYSYISTAANAGAGDGTSVGDATYTDMAVALGVRGNGGAYNSSAVRKIGQRYNVGDSVLKNVTVNSLATYSDGNVNTWSFKVWQWKGSYSATVAAAPLYSTTGKNHADCANFSVNIPTGLGIMGDIYYEIQYLSGKGGFTGWTAAQSVAGGVQTYIDGALKSGTYASTLTLVDENRSGAINPPAFSGKYHANVDTINGQKSYTNMGASTLQSTGVCPGRDAAVDGITVDGNTYKLYISGWMAVQGGIHHYAYSVNGHALVTAQGGKNGEPLSNYYAGNLGISSATQNGLFRGGAELYVDLSDFAGQTVTVTFYAIPQNAQSTAIGIVSIKNLAVPAKTAVEPEPEPEPEVPTEAPTEAPTEPTTDTATEAPTQASEGGCGSVVGFSAAAILMAAAAAVALKKD